MKKQTMISMCDKSGIMARPWAESGYTCICVDIQHSIRATIKGKHKVEYFEGGGQIHFVYGDARSWKPSQFDKDFHRKYQIMFVACFPVCTNLCGSGSQDWKQKGLAMLTDGLMLFNSCEQIADWSGAPYMCENPVGTITKHHREPDYTFQPWEYGDLYRKRTCLWVGNGFVMPPKMHDEEPFGVTSKIHDASPGPDRADYRSETPQAFARAVFEANNKTICATQL